MNERRRIWIGISAALFAGSTVDAREDAPGATYLSLDNTTSTGQFAAAEGEGEGPADAQGEGPAEAQGEGEGEGEGEGGGDGSSATADLTTNDIAFLERLGLIRGHLRAGHALYGEGLVEMAATHMKHPRDELYAGLIPAIRARGANPFDEALTALAEAVESDAGQASVDSTWRRVDEAIQQIETSLDTSTQQRLLAIAGIVTKAADEYALGVVAGTIDNTHEYQDAWGFVQVARQRLSALSGATEAESGAIMEASQALSAVASLWPNLAPHDKVDGDASRLYGAAARIELAARSI